MQPGGSQIVLVHLYEGIYCRRVRSFAFPYDFRLGSNFPRMSRGIYRAFLFFAPRHKSLNALDSIILALPPFYREISMLRSIIRDRVRVKKIFLKMTFSSGIPVKTVARSYVQMRVENKSVLCRFRLLLNYLAF